MPRIIDKSKKQRQAEADVERFKENLGPFVVAAEMTRMAMVFTDAKSPGNPIIFANDSFLELTGYDRNEVLGQRFDFLVKEGASSEVCQEILNQFTDKASAATEILYQSKSGTPFWVAIFVTPVRDSAGNIMQHFSSLIDLSIHKDEEAHSRMLIDELNHRVKNTLATVRSIVAQGLRTCDDVAAVREAIESRLFALSRSHDLLSRDAWRGAELTDLVREALKPFTTEGTLAERFQVTGEQIHLPPNATLALGIALHELATNAVKYGALSNEMGSVRLHWHLMTSPQGDRLILRWEETGGPPVVVPARRGFGSRVIERGLAHELAATTQLEFASAGLICTIDMPAPKQVRD